MRKHNTLELHPEMLEERVMLSGFNGFAGNLPPLLTTNIRVHASGDMGTEQFDLVIGGQTVNTFDVDTGFETYNHRVLSRVSANQVRIVFSGDQYDPDNGIDTNLNIDWIEINGERFETESPFVFSTGTYRPEDGIVPGYGRGETLHTDGYFQYATGSTIIINARGDTGLENFHLNIDGQTVATFEVDSVFDTYSWRADGSLSADRVSIVFDSDAYDPATGDDNNLTVDWIEFDGQRFETEAVSTWSFGSGGTPENILFGFDNGESLYFNGLFQFEAAVLESDTFSLPEDSLSVPLAVQVNDSNAIGYEVEVASFTTPGNGTLVLDNGVLLYSPNANFTGTDSFDYSVQTTDGSETTFANVQITVNDSHEQPQTLINPAVAPEITPSGLFLEVERLVQVPLGENNRQPRLNSMTFTGDRLFVATDGGIAGEGRIYEIVTDVSGNTSTELFLDVGAEVFANTGRLLDNTSPQGGLRSIAFHPDFDTNGKFYTSVMEERPLDPSQHSYVSDSLTPIGVDSVLIEWTYDSQTGQVDTTSYREVFRVGMHVYDHPIKGITFNQLAQAGDEDYGLLYIGHGDGSEQSAIAGDGLNNDALGKVLRINPLQNGSDSYSVPGSNPFVGDATMIDEAYAIGFRNPHNLTFANDINGDSHLIVTEVGRDNIEQINLVTKGSSYGWADREGIFVHDRENFGINGNISPLPANEAENGYTFPVSILGHDGAVGATFVAQAITGGHVIQNGSGDLDDQFIFAEFATDGRAYHIDFSEMLQQTTTLDVNDPLRDEPGELTWLTPQELTILFDHDNDDTTVALVRDSLKDILDDEPDFEVVLSAGKTRADIRLGQGPNGEMYILNKRNGWIYLVTNTVV